MEGFYPKHMSFFFLSLMPPLISDMKSQCFIYASKPKNKNPQKGCLKKSHTRVRVELGEVDVTWHYSLSFFFFVLPQGDTEVRLPESPERNTKVKYLLKRLGSGCTGCVCMCMQVEKVISYFYTKNPWVYNGVKKKTCSLLETILLLMT